MKSVAIIYGIAEGSWHGKLMRQALEEAGYTFEPNPEKADIVIAHSGGCFFLPFTKKHQTILLIGPPYWPGKPPFISMTEKMRYDFIHRKKEKKLGYLFVKTLWNGFYVIGDILHVFDMSRFFRQHDLMDRLPSKDILLIRNKYDTWCSPDISSIPTNNPIRFVDLPGDHDDCWLHPKAYIDLL